MGRFEKVLVLGVLFVAALSTFSFAQSTTENLVITTYYPSPAGSYRQLTVTDDNTAADRKALTVSQTGAVGGTGYAVYATKTGASTVNVGGYFSASGGTDNYGLIVAAGSVGIGTTAPQSNIQLNSGYVQIPRIAGPPANSDCDAASEIGRIAYSNNNRLYVCDGPGRQWDYVDLTN